MSAAPANGGASQPPPPAPDPATQAEALTRALWRRYGWAAAVLLAAAGGVGWAVPRLIDYGANQQAAIDQQNAMRQDISTLKVDVRTLDGKVDDLGRDVHAALAGRHVTPTPKASP